MKKITGSPGDFLLQPIDRYIGIRYNDYNGDRYNGSR